MMNLTNDSQFPFTGWIRTTTDVQLPAVTRTADGEVLIVRGLPNGADTWCIDVRCSLDPGQQRSYNLHELAGASAPHAWTPPAWPPNLPAHFGGELTINGTPTPRPNVVQDGAGWRSHTRMRFGRMMIADVFLTWYPDQPWMQGEILLTCSNPNVTDLTETLIEGVELRFGDAFVSFDGGYDHDPLVVPRGTTFVDGQAMLIPVIFAWARHFGPTSATSCYAAKLRGISAIGIENVYPGGNPWLPADFNAAEWMRDHWQPSINRVRDFQPAVLGPAPGSGVTGRQEDQMFRGGECMVSPGAVWPRYLAACKMANRPCHHRMDDGSMLDVSRYTERLVLWDGRAHWHWGVSPNRLGKTADLTIEQAGGCWGPDVEHWLINTLVAAARLTGSQGLQMLMQHQAVNYPLQWTVTPGWSNSQPFATRAVGYEAMNVVLLERNLADRALAARTAHHHDLRVEDVILPDYANRDIVDVRRDDPRMGTGDWWFPYQQAIAAYGLDLAGWQTLGLRLAQRVVNDAFYHDGNTWRCYAAMALDGRVADDNIFFSFGLPMAVAVVLKHNPNDERARSIWNQMLTAEEDFDLAWLPPEVA